MMNKSYRVRKPSFVNIVSSILSNEMACEKKVNKSFMSDEEIQMHDSICLLTENPNRTFWLCTTGNTTAVERLIETNRDVVFRKDDKGMTMLHHAAIHSKVDILDLLVVAGSDLNAKDNDGMTPIHQAVIKGQTYVVTYLILNGADPNIRNNQGFGPIHTCLHHKNLEILDELLKHPEVQINLLTQNENSGVHIACEINFPKGLELLLDHDARVCQPNKYGLYPIHLAIKHCNEECLNIIVSKKNSGGCTAQKIMNFTDREGNVPLHCAVNTGDPRSVKMCLELGAKIDVQQNDNSTPVHYACTKGEFEIVKLMLNDREEDRDHVLQIKDNNGHTPLHKAVMFDHTDLTEYLIQQGSDIESEDDNGWTPLLLAASRLTKGTFRILLQYGADVCAKDNRKRNIIHLFTLNVSDSKIDFISDIDKVQQMMINLVNEKDELGCTPLHYTTRRGLLRLTADLIRLGGVCMTQNNDKDTPLHFAAQYGRIHTCRKLLNAVDGMKAMNSTDANGKLPIHAAAENGHTKIIQMMLDRGCIFHRCYHGWSALHYAAANGHLESCQYLIEINPSLLDCENQEGKTALHLAAINDKACVVGLLLSSGATITKDKEGLHFFSHVLKLKNYQTAREVIENSSRWQEVFYALDESNVSPIIGMIKDMPSICYQAMDKSITTEGSRGHKEFKIIYNFGILQKTVANEEEKCRDPFYVVKTMVDLNRVDLLMHPLCMAYLKMKWHRFGRWIQFLIMFSYIIFLGALSTMIMLLTLSSFKHVDKAENFSASCLEIDIFYNHEGRRSCVMIMAWITLLYSVISLVKEVLQVVTQKQEYFFSLENYIDLTLYIGASIFSTMIIRGQVGHETMQVAAVTVFLAWFNLLLLLFHFELVGLYVIMFVQILTTVCSVLAIFSILFVGFAFSFNLLFKIPFGPDQILLTEKDATFNNNQKQLVDQCYSTYQDLNSTLGMLDTSLKAWQDFQLSLIKVVMMMLGEYDYLATFVSPYFDGNPQTLHYPKLTFMFLLLFIIFMSILMMNLLIGLAVGDIESVRSNASLKRIALQVVWLSEFESKLPMKCRNWVFQEIWTVYPFRCQLENISAGENQVIYKKQEKDDCKDLGTIIETLEIHNKQLCDLVVDSRQHLDLLKLILQKMEIDPEAEINDDFIPEGKQNKHWRAALTATNAITKLQKGYKSAKLPDSI